LSDQLANISFDFGLLAAARQLARFQDTHVTPLPVAYF
jgi:hypothetical protein